MTPTSELLRLWQYETNPVTKAVYRQIIGNRIDQANIKNNPPMKIGS